MGADLFIDSLYEPQRRQWEPRFEEAVRERDRHERGTAEYEEAQERVNECYDRMYAHGYFRDSYNDSNVLWKFGLSWGRDVMPLLKDGTQELSPVAAGLLLQQLEARQEVFEENMLKLRQSDRRYFRREAVALKDFLKTAIKRQEAIRCSV